MPFEQVVDLDEPRCQRAGTRFRVALDAHRARDDGDRLAQRPRRRLARSQIEGRILSKHGTFQLLQDRAGLEPEVFGKLPPGPRVHVERLCLPAAAVQRDHQLAHETFAMRMLTRKRLELAHEAVAVARLQLRIDVLFDRVEPQLFEAFDLGARERLLLETPERCTAPQGERVRDATFGDQPLESLQVQLIRLEVQLVPVRPRG